MLPAATASTTWLRQLLGKLILRLSNVPPLAHQRATPRGHAGPPIGVSKGEARGKCPLSAVQRMLRTWASRPSPWPVAELMAHGSCAAGWGVLLGWQAGVWHHLKTRF